MFVFFKSVGTNKDGHIRIFTTDNPTEAMIMESLSFDTIEGNVIKTLIEFIQKNVFKGTSVEFKTFKIKMS